MAGLNLQRRAMNLAMETLRKAVIFRRRPIPWEITWFPTFTCNLKCSYCCVPRENYTQSETRERIENGRKWNCIRGNPKQEEIRPFSNGYSNCERRANKGDCLWNFFG